jgi:hypothetical protein
LTKWEGWNKKFFESLNILPEIAKASLPETLITAIAPTPCGDEIEQIVSNKFMVMKKLKLTS